MQDNDEILKMIQGELNKAVTNGTYTFSPSSRSIYSPENLDPVIRVMTPVAAPVRGILPRVPGLGEAATFNMITSRLDNQAGGTGVSLGFADAGQPQETTQQTDFKAFPYKNLGRDVEIGRQSIASNRGKSIEDLRAKQEVIKTMEVILGEEAMILNGSAAANSLEFDGLNRLITTWSGTAGLATASGISTWSTSLYTRGSDLVTHFIANPRQMRGLSDELQAGGSVQRIIQTDQTGVTAGSFLTGIVDGNTGNIIKPVTSRYAYSWGYLLSQQSAAGDTYIEMEDLESLSVYDVPTANHAVKSRVFETTVLKLIGEFYQMKIGGLAQ